MDDNKEPINTDAENAEKLKDFGEKFLEGMHDSPPEFEQSFRKHFKDLLA